MNTNMKELNLNELEQVSGGEPITVCAVIGLCVAGVSLAVDLAKFGRKIYKNIKNNAHGSSTAAVPRITRSNPASR